MPVEFAFLVTDPPPPDPFQASGVTLFVGGGFLAGCDANFQDQIYFLGILERNYPAHYVEGLRSKPGGGYELFQAAAKVGERLSIAVNRLECCAFVITAEGGKRAVGTVELFRDGALPGDPLPGFTIKAGSVVTTKFGRCFVTTEDVTFEEYNDFELPPTVAEIGPLPAGIIAVDVGWEYNVPGQVIARNGEVLEGEISEIKCLIIDPFTAAAESLNCHVRQILPTSDGQAACLDGLAFDLCPIIRNLAEPDDEFRVRIKAMPDTVSCPAICRGIDALLKAIDPSLECCIREAGTSLLPGLFYDAGSSADNPQVPANNYAFDMDFELRPEDRYKVWLNTVEMRGFFLLCIPTTPLRGDGMFYDGSCNDTFPLQNAYDDNSPTNADSAWDGFSLVDGTNNKSITDLIKDKVACGVGFDFCIDDLGCF